MKITQFGKFNDMPPLEKSILWILSLHLIACSCILYKCEKPIRFCGLPIILYIKKNYVSDIQHCILGENWKKKVHTYCIILHKFCLSTHLCVSFYYFPTHEFLLHLILSCWILFPFFLFPPPPKMRRRRWVLCFNSRYFFLWDTKSFTPIANRRWRRIYNTPIWKRDTG